MADDPASNQSTHSGPVLVLSPVGRDGVMITSVLEKAGLAARPCANVAALCAALLEADAAIVAEETLTPEAAAEIIKTLESQPRWSDFPLIVLGVPNSQSGDGVFERLSPVANLTLLERPTRPFTLITVTRAALRSRARQYLTREHLEELEAARAEAERVGRMKDEFLATLSHELRTPLNAIAGWVNLLQRGLLSGEDQSKAIDTIARNTKAQRQLIEELLDMSRIISGKVRLEPQPVDLVRLVQNAVDSVRPTAEAKGIVLACETVGGSDPLPFINADPARLQQAVWNILTNAIKFTPQDGKVSVWLGRSGSQAQISVTDTGAGISPEFLPFVFDRFRQGDGSSRRSHGGLGLGLSIVKQLVEMHGGRVAVRSRGEGHGSTFSISIPISGAPILTPAASSGEAAEPKRHRPASLNQTLPLLRGLDILIVDDDDDGRHLLKRFLEDAKATVHSAANVGEARRMLETRAVDALLSDIAMPGEDGYDLIQWVRRSEDPRVRALPAAAISAFARSEDRSKALASGFDAHLAKPVDPDALMTLVEGLRNRAVPSTPGRHLD